MRLLLAVCCLATAALADGPPPEARQFDFWIGDWEVHAPDGRKLGESRIERIAPGWGLLETWRGAGGGAGRSVNTWLADRRQWRQLWVGTDGPLELTGGLDEHGAMVLAGTSTGPEGRRQRERITWTARPDGTVRQVWEQAPAEGAWSVVFDGIYRRRPG